MLPGVLTGLGRSERRCAAKLITLHYLQYGNSQQTRYSGTLGRRAYCKIQLIACTKTL
jgi:hypothetical protein